MTQATATQPRTQAVGQDTIRPFRVSVPEKEIWASPRSWVEAVYPDLAYINEAERGGHFAAWEEPQLFAKEVRAAFRWHAARRKAKDERPT